MVAFSVVTTTLFSMSLLNLSSLYILVYPQGKPLFFLPYVLFLEVLVSCHFKYMLTTSTYFSLFSGVPELYLMYLIVLCTGNSAVN
jgi:hypothetical protein